MVNGLMGYKRGMTQVFAEDGRWVPVTVLEVGPCTVVQIKTVENDGYEAVQLSMTEVPVHRVSRPVAGHFNRAGVAPARFLKEFYGGLEGISVGQVISADFFQKGEIVAVTGVSIGKGFQGTMKRHHFRGGPATHGSMFHRAPGSIGSSSFPSRVFKNMRMAGHMGNRKVTTLGLEVIAVRAEENIVFIKGSVPGSLGGVVFLYKSDRVGERSGTKAA